MLKILEGTLLDLGPEIWAGVLIVALIVIEIFQLGPHSFKWLGKGFSSAPSSRESKTGVKQKNMKRPRKKDGSEHRRRRRKESLKWLKDKSLNKFILVKAPCSVIYLSRSSELDAELVPRGLPNEFLSAPQADSATVYPDKIEEGYNYAVAQGEESDVAVLDQLEKLSKANRDVEQIFFFSSTIPSVFALQKFVELKEAHVERNVKASVLYEDPGTDVDSTSIQERQDFLIVNDISLEKVILVD